MKLLLLSTLLALPVAAQFKAADKDGRLEVRDGDKLVLGYQHKPLAEPKGGEIFAASAFFHPLATPSGFVLTDIQPGDHLHHLGVWWPWKLVEMKGKNYVTWEMQMKQGRHRAEEAGIVRADADEVVMNARNVCEVSSDGETYQKVIKGQVAMLLGRHGKDGYRLDIDIHHRPVEGEPITIANYRYSGFTWRGPGSWTKDTSTMLTSGGHHRENANHQAAKWCMVTGETPTGKATMLILSAAAMDGGKPELLRIWDSSTHHGKPFVNFNPVVKESVALKEENKVVSHRRYRLIMVDRELAAEEADLCWKQWTAPAEKAANE